MIDDAGGRIAHHGGSVCLPEEGLKRQTMPNIDWKNEDNIKQLRRLWKQGLSYREIGARLGCSRNAVAGAIAAHIKIRDYGF